MPPSRRLSMLVVVHTLAAGPAPAAAPKLPPGCQVASRTFVQTESVVIPGPLLTKGAAAPGAPATVVSSTLEVLGLGGFIVDVDVLTQLEHAAPDDLAITLSSPAGTVVTLSSNNGIGSPDAFLGVRWDDQANPGGALPYATNDGLVTDGSYATLPLVSVAPEEPLAAFLREDPTGIWTLRISDGVGPNGGVLQNWTLIVTTTQLPAAAAAPIHSTSEVVAIPPGPASVASVIEVPPGAGQGRLQNLRVITNLAHTSSQDLDVTLTSPSGTVVTLTTDNGGANQNVFLGTFWADGADPESPVPYQGVNPNIVTDHQYEDGVPVYALTPEEAFAAFDGEDPTGTWTLRVHDDTAGNGGSLDGWLLRYSLVHACRNRGHFDVGGAEDLVLRNTADNEHRIWLMNGVSLQENAPVAPALPAGQRIEATGHFVFGASQSSDLVIRDQASGQVEFWAMHGATRLGDPVSLTGAPALAANWKLSATADFNHDGNTDLLWRNLASQKLVVWTLGEGGAAATEKSGALIPDPDQAVNANWELVTSADFDQDNNPDFLWYNATSGKVVIWFLDANLVRLSGSFTEPSNAGNANWRVVASGDYGPTPGVQNASDTIPDIVWRNETTGKLVVWFMDGGNAPPTRLSGSFTSPDSPVSALDWTIVGPR